MFGQTPYIVRGNQVDYPSIMASDFEKALTIPVFIPGGFGELPAGTVLGKISESTSRLGFHVPYTPEDASLALATAYGAAYLVQDGAASVYAYVDMQDSYKFAVGDHLLGVDSEGTQIDLGAITAIDRTTHSHMAKISCTNQLTTALETSKAAWIAIQTTTGSPYTKAVGILANTVDTGVGANAKGADGVKIIGNAMLYKDRLKNYDSEVLTDLSWAREDGDYLIM